MGQLRIIADEQRIEIEINGYKRILCRDDSPSNKDGFVGSWSKPPTHRTGRWMSAIENLVQLIVTDK